MTIILHPIKKRLNEVEFTFKESNGNSLEPYDKLSNININLKFNLFSVSRLT